MYDAAVAPALLSHMVSSGQSLDNSVSLLDEDINRLVAPRGGEGLDGREAGSVKSGDGDVLVPRRRHNVRPGHLPLLEIPARQGDVRVESGELARDLESNPHVRCRRASAPPCRDRRSPHLPPVTITFLPVRSTVSTFSRLYSGNQGQQSMSTLRPGEVSSGVLGWSSWTHVSRMRLPKAASELDMRRGKLRRRRKECWMEQKSRSRLSLRSGGVRAPGPWRPPIPGKMLPTPERLPFVLRLRVAFSIRGRLTCTCGICKTNGRLQ